mgnify:CR=1 FL=1
MRRFVACPFCDGVARGIEKLIYYCPFCDMEFNYDDFEEVIKLKEEIKYGNNDGKFMESDKSNSKL